MDVEDKQRIQDLTDKFNQLFLEKALLQEPEDPFVATRITETDLTVYPELIEALPSIEEEFFRTLLTEEESKNAIYSCPRTAVKKNDSTLHGIQDVLAQATKPIDYYAHRRIQDNPDISPEVQHILFAKNMRVLLSDIAATTNQERSDNIHKVMKLPGKPQKIVESDTKPLINQEKLGSLMPSSMGASRNVSVNGSRIKGFIIEEENSCQATTTDAQSITEQAQNQFRGPLSWNDYQLTRDDAEGSSFQGQGPQTGSHKDINIRNDDIEMLL
ncbi:hypothetical protein AYI69_g10686 [Smittium culicis]|uniref:Uncharacterized protein n=1 Tax=Smittium culicis TaxID=133412 RepID=A0A1R1X420_9FUNG|nr:hypothetical protein AYI69_g10693 [Smittium culicis]OMJ09406.1 hypothetical protein AYI69_g10686 [Smittium culicis]